MLNTTVAAASVLVLGALVAGAVGASVPTAPATSAGTTAAAPRAAPDDSVSPPLEGARLVRGFEEPTARWGPGHRGIDLAAPVGATVRSPAAGVVVFAGRVVDRALVTVRHADGLRSSLEPVVADVAVGTAVARGDVLGRLATGGHCAGCLHWGVRDGERYVDPLTLLASGGAVRLLPGGAGRPAAGPGARAVRATR